MKTREQKLEGALRACLEAGVFSAPALKLAKDALGEEMEIVAEPFSSAAGVYWSAWRVGSSIVGNGSNKEGAISDLMDKERKSRTPNT